MHICISKLTVGSHYLNQCWDIVNWVLRNKLQWNLNRNLYIFFEENAFENVVWKMAAILSGLQCVKNGPWGDLVYIQAMFSLGRSHDVMTSWHESAFHTTAVTGGFPSQRASNGIFVVSHNKLLNKQSSCWWFETPSCSCDITVMFGSCIYILGSPCPRSVTYR